MKNRINLKLIEIFQFYWKIYDLWRHLHPHTTHWSQAFVIDTGICIYVCVCVCVCVSVFTGLSVAPCEQALVGLQTGTYHAADKCSTTD